MIPFPVSGSQVEYHAPYLKIVDQGATKWWLHCGWCGVFVPQADVSDHLTDHEQTRE